MKINLEGYDIIGTPEEILHLLDLLGDEIEAVEHPIETPERPAPASKPAPKKQRKVDWSKAAAFRKAGWSYKKIGDELGVSDVTVSAHLNK